MATSYDVIVAATNSTMAAMEERTQSLRTVAASYGVIVAATNSTMAAMEERTQSLRTMATTHELIIGSNGGGSGGAKLWPISGGN